MNKSVTYLKAFGIILMVLGHTMNSLVYYHQFVCMFHMPLFFFISGYCFKHKYLNEPKTYLLNRVKGIYWPYLKWSLVFLAFHNIFFHLNIYSDVFGFGSQVSYLYDGHEFLRRLRNIALIMCDHEQLLGGYWFLNAFFYGSVVAFLSYKLLRKVEIALIVNMAITFVLVWLDFRYPYRTYLLVQAFYASTFVLAGMLFAERKVPTFRWWGVLSSLVLTFIGTFFWRMGVGELPYDIVRILPFFVTAILATWSFYSIFTWLNEDSVMTKCLDFIGKNTLTILTWHLFSFKIVSLVIIVVNNLQIVRLSEFPVIFEYSFGGWWLIYAVVALFTTCCIAYCNRFIKNPWLKL